MDGATALRANHKTELQRSDGAAKAMESLEFHARVD
jgi:hypothetical protein